MIWSGVTDKHKEKESRIQATEFKFLRAITGKAKRERERERIRKAHIREGLRMEDTQNQIERNRLMWFGRVKRWTGTENQKDEWK
jgi:hypothetical protein